MGEVMSAPYLCGQLRETKSNNGQELCMLQTLDGLYDGLLPGHRWEAHA